METTDRQPTVDRRVIKPADLLRPIRLRALVAFVAGFLSMALLVGEWQIRALHHASLAFVILLFFTFLAAFDVSLRACWRMARGPKRSVATLWLGIALMGPLLWGALGWYGQSQWSRRNVPHNWPMTMVKMMGASLMEAQARYFYPHRLETDRLVMFYGDGISDPEAEALQMDRHLARMEALTGVVLKAKIWWVRGRLLGQGSLSMGALALGSGESPVGKVDYHELAHALIHQGGDRDSHPPTLLSEGWAEAQSLDRFELAPWALRSRNYFQKEMLPSWEVVEREQRQGTVPDPQGTARLFARVRSVGKIDFFLPELTDSFWYDHDAGPVYAVGGALVEFLLRQYGPEKFVQLYFSVRPGTFAKQCKRIYGQELESLEAEFWKEVERLAADPKAAPDKLIR